MHSFPSVMFPNEQREHNDAHRRVTRLDTGSEGGFKWFISCGDSQSPGEATQRSQSDETTPNIFQRTVAVCQNLVSCLRRPHL